MLQRLTRVLEGAGRPTFLSLNGKSATTRSFVHRRGGSICNMSSKSRPLPSALPIEVLFTWDAFSFLDWIKTPGSSDMGRLWDDWPWGGDWCFAGDCCCGHWGDSPVLIWHQILNVPALLTWHPALLLLISMFLGWYSWTSGCNWVNHHLHS